MIRMACGGVASAIFFEESVRVAIFGEEETSLATVQNMRTRPARGPSGFAWRELDLQRGEKSHTHKLIQITQTTSHRKMSPFPCIAGSSWVSK